MKFRALLLSSILAAAVSLPACIQAQDTQQKPAPDSTAAEPAGSQDATQPDVATSTNKNTKVKHDGGKDDVGAIGNRKLNHFDWYSMETDIKIGKRYAAEIERHMKMVDDPIVTEYVNRVGQNLVRNSDAKVPFTIKVVNDDEINAMALPGGPLYVNTGLIMAAEDEAELAGVMAHEIAHVALRHATRGQSWADVFNLMTAPVGVIGGLPGVLGSQGAGLAVPVSLLKFSRGFEAEADYFGVQYMYKAGYDPNALVSIFEKIQALEKRKPGALSQVFASHPQTPSRIKKSQEEIAAILPPRDHYVETTSDFSEVKARLAIARNQKPAEPGDSSKPTLRKTAGQAPGTDSDKKDEDRPKLQRRDQWVATPI
jgi:beta-barrel assembly-enhancing protease